MNVGDVLYATDINVNNLQLLEAMREYNKMFNTLVKTVRQEVLVYDDDIIDGRNVGWVRKLINWSTDMHLPIESLIEDSPENFEYFATEDENIPFLAKYARLRGVQRIKVRGTVISGILKEHFKSLTSDIRECYRKTGVTVLPVENGKTDNIRTIVSRVNRQELGKPLSVSFFVRGEDTFAILHRNETYMDAAIALVHAGLPIVKAIEVALSAIESIDQNDNL